jgi:hypothetical protein
MRKDNLPHPELCDKQRKLYYCRKWKPDSPVFQHKASVCAAWDTRPVNMKYLKLRHDWASLCSQIALDLYSAFRCSIVGYDTGSLSRDFIRPLQENAMITSWLNLELFYPAFLNA